MIGLLVYLALQATAPLPPPPANPGILYLPVRVESSVRAFDQDSNADPAEGLELAIVDKRTLRVQATVQHNENESIDKPRIKAWQSGSDLQIVLPLVSIGATPFEPACCLAKSQVDLLLTLPEGLPEHVTVRRERPHTSIIGEERLVPVR